MHGRGQRPGHMHLLKWIKLREYSSPCICPHSLRVHSYVVTIEHKPIANLAFKEFSKCSLAVDRSCISQHKSIGHGFASLNSLLNPVNH
jgi:hypothetical protein